MSDVTPGGATAVAKRLTQTLTPILGDDDAVERDLRWRLQLCPGLAEFWLRMEGTLRQRLALEMKGYRTMGCDIHAYVEMKEFTDSDSDKFDYPPRRWTLIARAHISRWYELFGAMAGTRHPEIEHVEPRGLPGDCDILTQHDFDEWKLDAHHTSWLSPDEFEAALNRVNGTVDMIDAHSIVALMRSVEPSFAVRIVFWFDN